MEVLKFKLSGKTAFFKKPDVNTYNYYTYNSIHKVSLLGIFGAIVGYGGYNKYKYEIDNKIKNNSDYPEFYEKLKDIKVAIQPLNKSASISKKIQVFNNSVGYASQETGGNLIVKEQWLENPSWNIYLLLDNDESKKICDYITNHKSIYQPYLGKNDHIADITQIEIYNANIIENKNISKMHSLALKSNIEFDMDSDDEDEEIDVDFFKYNEKLPVKLNPTTNLYEYEAFVYSNLYIDKIDENQKVYEINNQNIVFI